MIKYLDRARRYLWTLIEIGFLIVVLSLIAHLILGPSSGGFVKGVYDNFATLGKDVPSATLLGAGLVALIFWYVQQRLEK